MKLYVLTREGVYRHEILGVYTDENIAFSQAMSAIAEEPDDYHDIDIGTCYSDVEIEDLEFIASLKRKDGRVTINKNDCCA